MEGGSPWSGPIVRAAFFLLPSGAFSRLFSATYLDPVGLHNLVGMSYLVPLVHGWHLLEPDEQPSLKRDKQLALSGEGE